MAENHEIVFLEGFKKPKAPQFTAKETAIIVEEVEKKKDHVFGKFSGNVTKESKKRVWEDLAVKLTAICGEQRTASSVEKKWYNLQSAAVKQVSSYKQESQKTGGGPPPKKPTDISLKIVDSIIAPPKVVGVGTSQELDTLSIDITSTNKDDPTLPENFVLPSEEMAKEVEEIRSLTPKKRTVETVIHNLENYVQKKPNRKAKRNNDINDEALTQLIKIEESKVPSLNEKKLDEDYKNLKIKRLRQEIEQSEERHGLEVEKLKLDIEAKQLQIQLLKQKTAENENIYFQMSNMSKEILFSEI